MTFAIDEIKRGTSLIAYISYCYRIYDHCRSGVQSVKAAMTLIHEINFFHKEDNCNKHEDLIPCNEDISELRYAKTGYSAESAVVHYLHSLLRCTENQSVDIHRKDKIIQLWQVGAFLKGVIYIANVREIVKFDSPGAMAAKDDDKLHCKAVVFHDASMPSEQLLVLNAKDVVWTGDKRETLWTVCSESCSPKTRSDAQKERPACSYDFIPHAGISNHTDPSNCKQRPEEYWFNADRDKCVFFSHTEVFRIILILFSSFGATLTVLIAVLLLIEKYAPIDKTNYSGLSFLLLFSLCFLCSLTSIGQSSQWSCMLRHTAFGVTFTFSISCVLGKPIVVLIAFRATFPGNNANHSKN